MSRHRTPARSILVLLLAWALAGTAEAAVPRIVFPVVAQASYTDDFGAPRGSGRHQGNDIMAAKKSKAVAAEAGRVSIYTGSARAGCMLYLYGRSGTTYMYVHLNNDRTMENDNDGGCREGVAYAPGLKANPRVKAGQLIGFVGDSGDANGGMSHLHFELHPNGGAAVSPYKWLRAGYRLLYQRPPASVTRLALTVYGRIVRTRLDLDPDRVRVRVGRVRLSNGWTVKPSRDVTVTVPGEAVVRRTTGAGTAETTTLRRAQVGERVTISTISFPQTLRYARAAPSVHTAKQILLRGT
jgi:hypothetical protein